MVKVSASRAEDPMFDSNLCHGDFSGSSHTSDFKFGTPVATLPGAWRYRVSAGTGRPGVSMLWLGEVESLICHFYLVVAAHKLVWADPSLRYTSMLLGRLATNKQHLAFVPAADPVYVCNPASPLLEFTAFNVSASNTWKGRQCPGSVCLWIVWILPLLQSLL